MTLLLSALAHPLQIGAVAPSSSSVARTFVGLVGERRPILELGGGDGCISRALVEIAAPGDLAVLELDPVLHQRLARSLPCPVLRADAAHLRSVLHSSGLRSNPEAIVSTIPLRLMPREVVEKIARACAAVLAPGGVLLQICYDIVPPIPHSAGLVGRRVAYVKWNLPPATIWAYARPGELPAGGDDVGLYASAALPVMVGGALGLLTSGTARLACTGLGLATGAVQALRALTSREPALVAEEVPIFRVVPRANGEPS